MKLIYKYSLLFCLKIFQWTQYRLIDRIAIRYYGGIHPKNIYGYRNQFFLENIPSQSVILDVACGKGSILHALSKKIKLGIGVDLQKNNSNQSNLIFYQSDILQMNYQELKSQHQYEGAIYSHILEHLEYPVDLLKKVRAHKIWICVPSEQNWLKTLQKELGLYYFSDATHVREYTVDALRKEVEASGYTIDFISFNSEGEIICEAHL